VAGLSTGGIVVVGVVVVIGGNSGGDGDGPVSLLRVCLLAWDSNIVRRDLI